MLGAACALALLAPGLGTTVAIAEDDATFSDEQIDQMLAPIALHPDALLSQILMASTYPLDVAEAAQWSKAHPDQQGDEAVKVIEDKPWDPSVKSLVAFPPVLAMMDEKPDWVQTLGDAFLADPSRMMDRVQYMRRKAKEEGNLESSEQMKVSMQDPEEADDDAADTAAASDTDTAAAAAAAPQAEPTTVVVQQAPAQVIVVEPAQPEVVYVPTYNPTVVYGTWWWPLFRPWYWRPVGYGYGAGVATGIAFGIGIAARASLWGGVRWGRGRGDVNINVNRYNNINPNNRIQSRDGNTKWNHNPDRRGGTPYRDSGSREKYGRDGQASAGRNDARGRDASRDAAQNTLAQRGADPAAGRDQLRNDPQTRDRAQASANSDRAQHTDRSAGRTGGQAGDRGTTRSAAQGADRSQARASAQNAERSSARQSSQSRGGDSAFKGSGNAARTQQSISRGSSSRSSASSFGGSRGGSHGGSFGGGGGGGMRGGGGGGRRR